MLISKVTDETDTARSEDTDSTARRGRDYQSASELFDMMTKNQCFDGNVDDSLTKQDLVLLYKNLDLGTRLMSDANDVRHRKPNQRVETVIYDEPESDSDSSENYSKDDIQHIYNINQERINLLDNGSFDNLLCHKLGGLQIQSSEIITDSGTQFLFRDPFIKEQLRSLNAMASGYEIQSLLPTSLLDYVCCKRIKDNYNFYMENIIKYVQQTIDQLKRISNGDYLTDCAKEKWKKANKMNLPQNTTKILATSTSLQPAVECNETVTWHDVVHSEIDVRSLSKVLEKKIVLEIPKLICGSYKLFSKRHAESFIITFKREKQKQGVSTPEKYESRLDVVLKLRRLQTGQVTSNIDSVTILKASPAGHDLCIRENLPIAPQSSNNAVVCGDFKHDKVSTIARKKVEEIPEPEPDTKTVIDEIVTEMFERHVSPGTLSENDSSEMSRDNYSSETFRDDVSTEVSRHVLFHTENSFSNIETNDYATNEREIETSIELQPNSNCSCESSTPFNFRDVLVVKNVTFQAYNEATYNLVSPDELRATMLRLSMQKPVPEESSEEANSPVLIKKKSPARVRIKSPYENKSHILEEKKRNKLLEIRERRVKKKIALGENAKVCKHKYGKSGVVPQASVTKLSISNKSFYNSIYGHNMDHGKQRSQPRLKPHGRNSPIDLTIEHDDKHKSPTKMPDRNSRKYINRSYYLDDTETEIMYMSKIQEDVKDTKICSPSTSTMSTDFKKNLSFLSELTGVDLPTDDSVHENQSLYDKINLNSGCCNKNSLEDIKNLPDTILCNDMENDESKGAAPVSLECRKSIEKLYNLIRKLENSSKTEVNTARNLHHARNPEVSDVNTATTLPASDSGTSLKHYVTSSNPSSFSFDKTNIDTQRLKGKKEHTRTVPTAPKVIISSKIEKLELKRVRKRLSPNRSVTKVALDNPLKGISQILQEVDNVQKIRQTKFAAEPKPVRKPDVQINDGRPVMIRHTLVKRRSRFDQYNMKDDPEKKTMTSKDKRSKPLNPTEMPRILQQQQIPVDDRSKKKIADIIDEVKEARGEAVRGPSKPNSRIMTLAQPKRTYVQAHSEEYQTKYGRNLMADRLQRLAGTLPSPTPSPPETILRNIQPKNRTRREAISNVSAKPLPSPVQVQPIDKNKETHLPASNSPQTMSGSRNFICLKASDPPEKVKKMVAVESYVRNHYGRLRHTEPTLLRNQIMNDPRVLLLPKHVNISNSSADELGKELHHIIDSIVTSSPNRGSLADEKRTNFNISPTLILEKTNSINDDDFDSRRTDSDFDIGVLDDKSLKTAVQSQGNGDKRDDTYDNDSFESPQDHLQTSHSTVQLEKLENALYSQLSFTFQKRLRLKNLTPKPSLNHVFLLQAGDTKSLIVKSTVSNVSAFKDLKAVSRLSPHLNWDFAQIPVQIATVGYAYPLPEPETGPNPELMTRLGTSLPEFSPPDTHSKSDKISQCFKGGHQETYIEQPAQVDVQDILIKAFGSKQTFTVSEFISGADNSDGHEDNIKADKFTVTEKSSNEQQSLTNTISVTSTEAKSLAQDNVEYTTSLDILVGLLNEIQKITRPNPPEDIECMNQTMLKGTSAEVNGHRDIAITPSFDKFDPNTGIYSYYISNNLSDKPKPPYLVDKEVSVDMFVQKELKNTFTEVPSIFPVVLNRVTSTRNSLVKVFPRPSSQSLISLDDYRSMCSKASCASRSSNIVELPVVNPVQKKVKEVKKGDLNAISCDKAPRKPKHKDNTHTVISVVRTKRHLTTKADFDPSIKIKRDILVTVYSILVFTVFAALSFPDMTLFGA